ncbi:hypothetical protein RI054_35g133630 [Pseudoscourfieldia marina]
MTLSTPAPQVGVLFCKTYSQEAVDAALLRSNHGNGGDPTLLKEFESEDDDKVMEELEELGKNGGKAAPASTKRGKKVWTSIASLLADMPYVALLAYAVSRGVDGARRAGQGAIAHTN